MAIDSTSFLKRLCFPIVLQSLIFFTEHFDLEIDAYNYNSFIFMAVEYALYESSVMYLIHSLTHSGLFPEFCFSIHCCWEHT